ncbi:hypothetical protein AAMO2058_001359700 [Amorphochlora amoebiformis]
MTAMPIYCARGLRISGLNSRRVRCRGRWRSLSDASNSANNYYGETLLLPSTPLPIRANASSRELDYQPIVCDELYERQKKERDNNPTFVLHDGPPYANGDLHMGHAMNKILKDIINRHKLLKGYKIDYIPGWDCHGLPIELKAMDDKASEKLSPEDLRRRAGDFAKATVEKQLHEFQRWGVMADWKNAYKTLDPEYEAAQLRVFLQMVQKGLIYRASKPVYWSPSSRTALAEAELEYVDDHISQSVYLSVDLIDSPTQIASSTPIKALIWTTTPWTLPANEAIAFGEDITYALVRGVPLKRGGIASDNFILAANLIDRVEEIFECKLAVQATFPGSYLSGASYSHFFDNRTCPIVTGPHVTDDDGTGLVHIAPAHGQEDFEIGRNLGLPVTKMVDEKGLFTSDAASGQLEGFDIHGEGSERVVRLLEESGNVVCERNYKHRYPYDWRTKKPVIQRATSQWFTNLNEIQAEALNALNSVKVIPEGGVSRMRSMLGTRTEWCISRQRNWGVPIPVFYDENDEPVLDPEAIERVIDKIQLYGSDCWWTMEVSGLVGEFSDKKLRKGTDTLDVWFDSGVSWASVVQERGLSFPSDMVLEGSDQHRGWFQSSLLTHVAANGGGAPYKSLVTHGFVLDEKNRKMSKSVGNVIYPSQLVDGSLPPSAPPPPSEEGGVPEGGVPKGGEGGKKRKKKKKAKKSAGIVKGIPTSLGADVLRLWVASSDYTQDVNIGPETISRASGQYRKIRNTLRFIIGCLNDWDCSFDFMSKDTIVVREKNENERKISLNLADRYMLHLQNAFNRDISDAYDRLAFSQAMSIVNHFINTKLSAFYLDTSKDRLYADGKLSDSRRAAQAILTLILENLVKALAPVVPHISQEIYHFTPKGVREGFLPCSLSDFESVFSHGWLRSDDRWTCAEVAGRMRVIERLADEVNKRLEVARKGSIVRSSLEAEVKILTDSEKFLSILLPLTTDRQLASLLRVSHVSISSLNDFVESSKKSHIEIGDQAALYSVSIASMEGEKCPRCWNWGELAEGKDVCVRCSNVLTDLGIDHTRGISTASEVPASYLEKAD